MLSTEDREVLGIQPEANAARRSSAVSQVLRAIRGDLEGGAPAWDLAGTAADPGLAHGRLILACDRTSRQRAYTLAQRVYTECGLAGESAAGGVSSFDAHPQTLTLLVEDDEGRAAATISLVFDSSAGLPCDEIYAPELEVLRAQGRKLVEVMRLAIAPEHTRSKLLLVRLFNFIYIFARRVKGFDDFVIEVNPRHAAYYRRLLSFEVLGSTRACPRVQGAPAVLLRVALEIGDREVRRVGGQGAAAGERTLYPYFYTWFEEGAVAELLARQHRPMSAEERRYFGLEAFERVLGRKM